MERAKFSLARVAGTAAIARPFSVEREGLGARKALRLTAIDACVPGEESSTPRSPAATATSLIAAGLPRARGTPDGIRVFINKVLLLRAREGRRTGARRTEARPARRRARTPPPPPMPASTPLRAVEPTIGLASGLRLRREGKARRKAPFLGFLVPIAPMREPVDATGSVEVEPLAVRGPVELSALVEPTGFRRSKSRLYNRSTRPPQREEEPPVGRTSRLLLPLPPEPAPEPAPPCARRRDWPPPLRAGRADPCRHAARGDCPEPSPCPCPHLCRLKLKFERRAHRQGRRAHRRPCCCLRPSFGTLRTPAHSLGCKRLREGLSVSIFRANLATRFRGVFKKRKLDEERCRIGRRPHSRRSRYRPRHARHGCACTVGRYGKDVSLCCRCACPSVAADGCGEGAGAVAFSRSNSTCRTGPSCSFPGGSAVERHRQEQPPSASCAAKC